MLTVLFVVSVTATACSALNPQPLPPDVIKGQKTAIVILKDVKTTIYKKTKDINSTGKIRQETDTQSIPYSISKIRQETGTQPIPYSSNKIRRETNTEPIPFVVIVSDNTQPLPWICWCSIWTDKCWCSGSLPK